MRILIYGAGTIGVTYGWLLEKAGHEVRVLVREAKKESAERDGFQIHYTDMRVKPKTDGAALFKPNVVTGMDPGYDLILVTVTQAQLPGILPELRARRGGAPILFFLNHWDTATLASFLSPEEYLLGFPMPVCGGKEGLDIFVMLANAAMLLGEGNGALSTRLQTIAGIFTAAGLKVETRQDMTDWLPLHFLQPVAGVGPLLKAGSYENFARDGKAVREMLLAYREGLRVCQKRGIDTRRFPQTRFFGGPLLLVAPLVKMMFNQPEALAVMPRHVQNAMPEWVHGYDQILETGKALGVPMPVWESFKPVVERYRETN